MLSGRYLFEVDGSRFTAEPGDVVSVPGGAAHAFLNLTDEPARQTVLILPGLDAAACFTALAAVMQGGMADRSALDAFRRLWGADFLDPPLRAG